MGEVAREGRTVLFVSHNMTTIQSLCERVVWLEQGELRKEGTTSKVTAAYLEDSLAREAEPLDHRADRGGYGSMRVRSITIEDAGGGSVITTGSRLRITLRYASSAPIRHLRAFVTISALDHAAIYALNTDSDGGLPEQLPSTGTLTCVTSPVNVTAGRC